jgi:glycosyltransferase involved in cell wall biosynthesis
MAQQDFQVALDVAPLRARPAGVGVYVHDLATALVEIVPGQLSLIGRRAEAELEPALSALPAESFRYRHYHAWMQLEAVRSARRRRARLVHFTNAAAPLVGAPPYVLTVHDLSVLRMPLSHPWSRLATVPVSVAAMRAARRIIVPSQATAEELTTVLRLGPDRVSVVRHAASAAPLPEPADVAAAVERLSLGGAPYLLALGTIEPRKNHLRLLSAFEMLADSGHDLRLVIAGELGWRANSFLRRIARSRWRERLVRTGYLPAAELRALIAGCAAACYVSLYEGFGLPIIEAMALGAPVVTSNVSSMPEVAGGAAVLVDPRDPGAIAAGIEEAMARRDELVAAGRAHAARRSWADAARETLEVYRRAIEA